MRFSSYMLLMRACELGRLMELASGGGGPGEGVVWRKFVGAHREEEEEERVGGVRRESEMNLRNLP